MPADEVLRLTAEWLQYAREDLALAQNVPASQPGRPRHVAYHAQQAAEKAIKAILVFEQVEFPFTHELDALRNLAPDGYGLKSTFPQLGSLSRWAVRARYPMLGEPNEDEAAQAEQLAEGVVRMVEEELGQQGVK